MLAPQDKGAVPVEGLRSGFTRVRQIRSFLRAHRRPMTK